MKITPSQIAAAMGLMRIQAKELAELTDTNEHTLGRLLKGATTARASTLETIKTVLEAKGVEFLENEGVRKKSNSIDVFEGPERFEDFTEFMYRHLKEYGGAVCMSVTNERLFQKYRKNVALHRQRMKELTDNGKVTGRILAAEGEFKKTWADIRRIPQGAATSPVSFYAFGKCLALISFDNDPAPYVVLLKTGPFAEAFRQSFNLAWESAEVI